MNLSRTLLRLRCGAALLALALAGAAPALAQRPAAEALPSGLSTVTSVEGITEYRLANGLQLLLVPDDSKPSTTVNLTIRVGSRHEGYGETGMAHLLEHMLFKGTPTHKNVWADFTKRGLRANGTTWYDRTNYFASFSANPDNLRWYMGWLADAMVNSLIAKADLDTEMTVVRNEFENGENNPTRVLLQQTMAAMYQWHNYGKSTIGARSDIENVDIERLQAFYRKHYQPDNATLIVSGRFDRAAVLAQVAADFGKIPRPQRALPPTYTLDPPQDGERIVHVRRVGGTPLVFLMQHTPAGSDPDFAAIRLLQLVLGDTPGGRLHKQLVEKQLAAGTFAFAFSLAEPGALLLAAQLAPGQDLDKARAAMAAVVDGVAGALPVTAEELERARTTWLNGWERGFADPERIGVQISEAIAQGDWRLYFLARDQVRKATLAEVQRVAAAWLKRDARTFGLYHPTDKPERAPQGVKVDVAALVKDYRGDATAAQAEAFDATPANLDQRTQKAAVPGTGVQAAWLAKGTRGNAVTARLTLRFGDEKSLFGQETVGSFVGAMLDKGGAGLTRQQIADAFDKLQASVSFGGGEQAVTAAITTKRQHLPAVIELVGRLLREPAFPAEALEETRRQSLAALAEARKEPDAVIARLLARHGNPYPRGDLRHAPSFDEQEQDVKAVTVEQLRAYHRRFYSAARGEFAAVGDLDAAAMQAALAKALGGWTQPAEGAAPFVRVPRPLVLPPPARFVERTPDKANANLRGLLPLPLSDRHADYPALALANYIFGLGGNSRLWVRIRETEGLSYDVRSVLDVRALEEAGSMNLSAIFAPQNQPKVEAALQQELARSLKDGFTQQELDEGRAGYLNFRRLSRAQDGAVAAITAGNLYLGRDWAFAQAFDDALAKVTLAQLNAVWRKYVDPARFVMAWGGDFK